MMKLFSKNSNLCDHNPPTSQTDGQTDRQTDRQTDDMRSQYRALHYSASRGKNRPWHCQMAAATTFRIIRGHCWCITNRTLYAYGYLLVILTRFHDIACVIKIGMLMTLNSLSRSSEVHQLDRSRTISY